MLGSPIAHSRSPQLHLAAYRALKEKDGRDAERALDLVLADPPYAENVAGDILADLVQLNLLNPGKVRAWS